MSDPTVIIVVVKIFNTNEVKVMYRIGLQDD